MNNVSGNLLISFSSEKNCVDLLLLHQVNAGSNNMKIGDSYIFLYKAETTAARITCDYLKCCVCYLLMHRFAPIPVSENS